MIEKFIKWLARNYIQIASIRSYNTRREEEAIARRKMDLFMKQSLIGKKVIVLSNEWEDMTVGVVTRVELITQAKQPTFVVKDCFTKEELLTFNDVMEFDKETLQTLLKLNPYERWNLVCSNCPVNWTKKKIGKITDPTDFYNKLENIGFI